MDFTIAHIAHVTNGIIHGDSSIRILNLLIDSRKKFSAENSLFVAISGERNDGHNYIKSTINKGVKSYLVEYIPENLKKENVNWIVVKNSLVALQKLAANHRLQFNYPVIAITGSNGKTIVKEWIYQVLHKHYNIVRSPKSYNSQIGVPLSVLNMDQQHNLAVFEAGISEPGEMKNLQNIIQPTIGIFTNIGDAHAKGFSSTKQKIQEKLNLFTHCEVIVYQRDNQILHQEITNFATKNKVRLFTWSFDNSGDIQIEIDVQNDVTILHIKYQEDDIQLLKLPFSDNASIENAINVWMLTKHLNLHNSEIQQAFDRITPIEMRLNLKSGINNCLLVSDFYNVDLISLEIAMDWTDRQKSAKSKTIILSDIEQSELTDHALYKKVNELLISHQYENIIGIGENITAHKSLFNITQASFHASTEAFLDTFNPKDFENQTILLKGSRSFKFELIEKKLQRQVHNTVLEVNMNALHQNLNFFKSKLKPTTKLMVMVKAYSYGSGGHEIAHFLQYHGVDYLAVAYADEGIALRNDGIKTPIMVMNSDHDSFDKMLEYDLEPEVFSFKSLEILSGVLQQYPGKQCKVHVEFNSGMNRLGFDRSDLEQLITILNHQPQIKVKSIFSHLAGSDLMEMADYTAQQIMAFNDFYILLSEGLKSKPIKHILNSTGIIHNGDAQFDMVRLGIGLYGIDPSFCLQDQLLHVGTLWSTISQIREVAANDGVSYGKHSASNQKRKIAVVAIGYADGLNRGLSQGKGYFTIHGQMAPIVGNVCMDMTMCDVTNIECSEGDSVQIFGNSPTINELAQSLNTIPYEILTSVSQRVKRIFTEE